MLNSSPRRPTVEFEPCGDKICMDHENARRLGLYLLEIRRWTEETEAACTEK